jgi:hypothetical protein
MKFTNSWKERQSITYMADEAMKKYLQKKNLIEGEDWVKLGPEPKLTPNMKRMWIVLKIVLLPDYIVVDNNILFIIEVKGTLRFKESDYLNLKEMYCKSKKFDNVEIGILYFKNQLSKPSWFSYKKIKSIWENNNISFQYYPIQQTSSREEEYYFFFEI